MAEERQLLYFTVCLLLALCASTTSTAECTVSNNLIATAATAHINGTALSTKNCSCATSLSDQTTKKPLTLLVLAPYDTKYDVVWPGGPWLFPATRLAVQHINSNECLLPNYNLEVIEQNSGCALWHQTLLGYIKHVLHSEKNIIGVVGPACSPGLNVVNSLNYPDRVPVVQVTIATTPLLDNAAIFPYTFSTLTSGGQLLQAFVELVRENCWKKIAVIKLFGTDYFETVSNTLKYKLETRNVSVRVFDMIDAYVPLNELILSELRVVLFLGNPDAFCQFICRVYQNKPRVVYPTYQFVFAERSEEEIAQCSLCNDSVKTKALQNAIFILNSLNTSSKNETVSGLTLAQFAEEYNEFVEGYMKNSGYSYALEVGRDYATVYYDSVWSLALCLDHISRTSDIDLSDYRPGLHNNAVPDAIRECLFQLSFKGVSGTKYFDRETRQALTSVHIFQFANGSLLKIRYFDGMEFIKLRNGTFIEDFFEKKFVSVNVVFSAVILLTTCLLLVLTVFFHMINIVYSKHKDIKASSPKLTHIIFIGNYAILVAIMAYIMPAMIEITNGVLGKILCYTHRVLSGIGVTLIFATVLVRKFRLYRIFIHYMRPGGYMLKDKALVLFILLLLVPTVCVYIIALSAVPIMWKNIITFNSRGDTPIEESRYNCHTEENNLIGTVHVIVLLVYYWTLLLFSLCLSFITRNINRQYRTTRSINALVYSLVLVYAFGIAFTVIGLIGDIFEDRRISQGIHFVTLQGVLLVCVLFLYLPPAIPLLKEKWLKHSPTADSELRQRSSVENETKVATLSVKL